MSLLFYPYARHLALFFVLSFGIFVPSRQVDAVSTDYMAALILDAPAHMTPNQVGQVRVTLKTLKSDLVPGREKLYVDLSLGLPSKNRNFERVPSFILGFERAGEPATHCVYRSRERDFIRLSD